MASTPLYKALKSNGTSFYAFPGASEDISAAYQNSNYKMYFSKYVLLNLPKQNTVPGSGSASKPVYFDFDDSFERSYASTPTTNYSEAMIESLRNYVANQEVVIRESRLNNTKYYYDTNALETTTEKIFFKWCKKLGIIDFEPAVPEDEYFSGLSEFQSRSTNDDEYFPEFLWKERTVTPYGGIGFNDSSAPTFNNFLEVEFESTTNFRVGDLVNIYGVEDFTILNYLNLEGYDSAVGLNTTVLNIIPSGATQGQRIVFNVTYAANVSSTVPLGYVELVYDRLIQYVGEVNGISNVQEANRSYTEVYAHIPDHTGQTPDILFRTSIDRNYGPNLSFPILPSQYQPEITGAELFNSPIVSTPQNYPGSYLGQFDTLDFTYETATGDFARRSGDYFGVTGDINNPVVDGSTLDGVTLDFNINHYVKMNLPRRSLTNFDQFNAQQTNNQPPVDFEFNAILWYYTVENSVGESKTNLYGISFLDHPDNNQITSEIGLRFPSYKKLVSNGNQDGTSYAFSLNLNFNIINENPIDTYNPEAINSLFSMNLFNDAMKKLSSINDSFLNIISEQISVNDEISNIKSLLYTQTDINVLNTKIKNLENLLRLYSTNQMVSSETISVSTVPGTPPLVSISNISTEYSSTDVFRTSQLYNAQGIIPLNLAVTENRSFMVKIINNDSVDLNLPNNDKLTIVFDRDLYIRQSIDLLIESDQFSTQNKKLDIYMRSEFSTSTNPVEVLLIGGIDLPVYYNSTTQLQNSSYMWQEFKFNIDFNQPINLVTGNKLEVPFSENAYLINNSIKPGDTLKMNNFFVGTSSVYNFSGQYVVDSLTSATSSYVTFDISSNVDLVAYGASASLPLQIHGTSSSMLSNLPYFSLNKGKKIKITRISNSDILSDRYHIQVDDNM
jgi:hypothetical protein